MCFRPPTIEGAKISCTHCGFEILVDLEKCPRCGTPNAAKAVAAPSVMPKVPGFGKPSVPGPVAPTQPGAPPALKAPHAAASGNQMAAVATAASSVPPALRDPGPDDGQIRIPAIGGVIRTPRGFAGLVPQNAPSVPAGPGFEEAPDISNTGNYFTTGNYNNG